jgi:hypothetical protein
LATAIGSSYNLAVNCPLSKNSPPILIFALPEGVRIMPEQNTNISTVAVFIFALAAIFFIVSCVAV